MSGQQQATVRPILIRRAPEAKPHGHHGGGWKVAYADFVTAMMAFFLLLWLVGSADKDTLKGLAEFFSDAKVNVGPPGGTEGILAGFSMLPNNPVPAPPDAVYRIRGGDALLSIVPTIVPGVTDLTTPDSGVLDHRGPEALESALRAALAEAPELSGLQDSLVVDETAEGLRIQLIDRDQLAMFPVGSDAMYAHTRRLIGLVVTAVGKMPGRISIRGHADALPFPPGASRDNWSLSSDRANATRHAMVEAGLDPTRVAEVVGKGDAEPLIPQQPHDARNRRISIVLLREPFMGRAEPATGSAAPP
ncbi:MAG: flagellar motor protein MotB [Geminicoccaceae bacterium]